jgi:hypothetical protein
MIPTVPRGVSRSQFPPSPIPVLRQKRRTHGARWIAGALACGVTAALLWTYAPAGDTDAETNVAPQMAQSTAATFPTATLASDAPLIRIEPTVAAPSAPAVAAPANVPPPVAPSPAAAAPSQPTAAPEQAVAVASQAAAPARAAAASRAPRPVVRDRSVPRPLSAQAELGPLQFRGTLAVDSVPSGARLAVDGQPVGVTPLLLDSVVAGSHVVRVELDGYRSSGSAVRVVADQQNAITITLDRVR